MIKTITIAVLCLCANLAQAQSGATRVASKFEWRQDLEFLAEQLPEVHPDPWGKVTEEEFRAEVDELLGRMTTLSEGQSTFEIARIVGLLGDQNTVVDVSRPMQFAPVLPMQFIWLSDGLYVSAIAGGNRGVLGTKVIGMGGVPIEDLKERVSAYGSWENETSRQRAVADLLRFPAVLKLCGIENARASMLFEFERDGEYRIRKVTAIPLGGTHPWTRWNQSIEGQIPVSLLASMSPYTSAFLGAKNTMFVSINTQTEDPGLPIDDFVNQLMDQIAEHEPARIVIDLRFNQDRNQSIVSPMIDAIADTQLMDKVIVLVGQMTSATAAGDAIRFREHGALLMGVATAGNPGGCMGQQDLVLPNSGMPIRVSTEARTDTEISTVTPDITVPWTGASFFGGIDPVLDAALEYEPEEPGEG